MIVNVVDRRTNQHRWKMIDAIIEATWHDNAIPGADQAEQDHREPGFAGRKGLSLAEATTWASSFDIPLTLYLYDHGSDAVTEWPTLISN